MDGVASREHLPRLIQHFSRNSDYLRKQLPGQAEDSWTVRPSLHGAIPVKHLSQHLCINRGVRIPGSYSRKKGNGGILGRMIRAVGVNENIGVDQDQGNDSGAGTDSAFICSGVPTGKLIAANQH